MRIESVSSQPDRAGRYRVCFEDGSIMRLYKQTVQDFTLYPGQELTREQMRQLKESAGAMSAKMRAVRIVSATNVSKSDLRSRLIQKGEDPKQAEAAVQWMADMDLVDDAKTAELIVQKCVHKGYGIARAKQALYEKRIPKEFWEGALANYPDQTETVTQFLRSRLGPQWDRRDLQKAMDALVRRGFSYPQIREGLKQLEMDTSEFPEEF